MDLTIVQLGPALLQVLQANRYPASVNACILAWSAVRAGLTAAMIILRFLWIAHNWSTASSETAMVLLTIGWTFCALEFLRFTLSAWSCWKQHNVCTAVSALSTADSLTLYRYVPRLNTLITYYTHFFRLQRSESRFFYALQVCKLLVCPVAMVIDVCVVVPFIVSWYELLLQVHAISTVALYTNDVVHDFYDDTSMLSTILLDKITKHSAVPIPKLDLMLINYLPNAAHTAVKTLLTAGKVRVTDNNRS